jgi:hypothetical protein
VVVLKAIANHRYFMQHACLNSGRITTMAFDKTLAEVVCTPELSGWLNAAELIALWTDQCNQDGQPVPSRPWRDALSTVLMKLSEENHLECDGTPGLLDSRYRATPQQQELASKSHAFGVKVSKFQRP